MKTGMNQQDLPAIHWPSANIISFEPSRSFNGPDMSMPNSCCFSLESKFRFDIDGNLRVGPFFGLNLFRNMSAACYQSSNVVKLQHIQMVNEYYEIYKPDYYLNIA